MASYWDSKEQTRTDGGTLCIAETKIVGLAGVPPGGMLYSFEVLVLQFFI